MCWWRLRCIHMLRVDACWTWCLLNFAMIVFAYIDKVLHLYSQGWQLVKLKQRILFCICKCNIRIAVEYWLVSKQSLCAIQASISFECPLGANMDVMVPSMLVRASCTWHKDDVHSCTRAGAPHPHRVRAPPHPVFARSPGWVRQYFQTLKFKAVLWQAAVQRRSASY